VVLERLGAVGEGEGVVEGEEVEISWLRSLWLPLLWQLLHIVLLSKIAVVVDL
jgi:hypothetical protein